jgi:hypothetical protein
MRQPPRLATWLLQRFGVTESTIGDVIERFQTKQSARWFWRQSVSAVRVTIFRDIQENRAAAIRAVIVGCAIQWLLLFMLRDSVRIIGNMPGQAVWNWTVENGFDGLRSLWFGARGRSGAPVLLTLCLVSGVTGWLVGVLHRSRSAVMATAYAASTPILVAVWLYGESNIIRLTSALAFNATFLLLVIPLCALVGGLWATAALGGGEHKEMTANDV